MRKRLSQELQFFIFYLALLLIASFLGASWRIHREMSEYGDAGLDINQWGMYQRWWQWELLPMAVIFATFGVTRLVALSIWDSIRDRQDQS